jgi:hypothetical protein
MATNQIYNTSGDLITTQQMSSVADYNVYTFNESDKLKTIQKFKNFELLSQEYFLDASETITEVVAKMVMGSNIRWALYTNPQTSGNFIQWDCIGYKNNGELSFQNISVIDEKNRPILSARINPTTNAMVGFSKKYYYGNQIDNYLADMLLIFDYNTDGSLSEIYDINNNWGYNWKGLDETRFKASIIAQDFIWDDHPYYHTLTPYLPEGVL